MIGGYRYVCKWTGKFTYQVGRKSWTEYVRFWTDRPMYIDKQVSEH